MREGLLSLCTTIIEQECRSPMLLDMNRDWNYQYWSVLSGFEPRLKLYCELSWLLNITLILYIDGMPIGPSDKEVVLP